MRLLVCGGREFTDRSTVFAALDAFDAKYPVTTVIHGAQRGADTLAGLWAKARGKEVLDFPMDQEHGDPHYEGRRRNGRMLHEGRPGCVIAFPGNEGTAHMVRIARGAGLVVWEPEKQQEVP